MLARVFSCTHFGLETRLVEVEVDISRKSFPGFLIVGLPNKEVEEARERVKTAIVNSGFDFPNAKIIVNLAPADLPKEGSNYDLPIALGILSSLGILQIPDDSLFYGELSLDGSLRHTKGVFLLGMFANEQGIKNVFVPEISSKEATCFTKINVYPVKDLNSLVRHLRGEKKIERASKKIVKFRDDQDLDFDFSDIQGQDFAKRGAEIAVAGGHNILFQGPPGAGKTMIARAMPGIFPPLTYEESLEVTKIYSLTGDLPLGESLISKRPFRAVHHTTSRIGIIGGGTIPHPGEITLAHRGVLFLDELAEFPRSILEALRQPLEDGEVRITRSLGSVVFPCKFILVAATNPCPCGYFGDSKRECKCTPWQITKYKSKLSGPILDRIDLHVYVQAVDPKRLSLNSENKNIENSNQIRRRVIFARNQQRKRFKGTQILTNAEMKNKDIEKFVKMESEAKILLKQAASSMNLSARTYFRTIKVAQTIADLKGEKMIDKSSIAEALQFRVKVDDVK